MANHNPRTATMNELRDMPKNTSLCRIEWRSYFFVLSLSLFSFLSPYRHRYCAQRQSHIVSFKLEDHQQFSVWLSNQMSMLRHKMHWIESFLFFAFNFLIIFSASDIRTDRVSRLFGGVHSSSDAVNDMPNIWRIGQTEKKTATTTATAAGEKPNKCHYFWMMHFWRWWRWMQSISCS